MYEKELDFLNKHLDIIDNQDWYTLWNLSRYELHDTTLWNNILDIFFDPDVNINLLEGLTEVPPNLFYGYHNLPDGFKIPDTITRINSGAFAYSNWNDTCKFSSNLQFIDSDAFRSCDQLTKIILPESVQRIGYMGFYECGNVKSIQLPLNLSQISSTIFNGCNRGYHPEHYLVNTDDKNKVFPKGIEIVDKKMRDINPYIDSAITGKNLGRLNDFKK